jgi:hypothetical protein
VLRSLWKAIHRHELKCWLTPFLSRGCVLAGLALCFETF